MQPVQPRREQRPSHRGSAERRRKGDPYFADSIGAVPGADTHGPTALLKSVLHYDQTEVTSGFVLNLKFDKALFATDKGKNGFVGLVKTYFAYGGQQVQVNVLDKDELIDAQLNPKLTATLSSRRRLQRLLQQSDARFAEQRHRPHRTQAMTGNVFAIQRYSLHDGAGIRRPYS